MAKFKYGVVAFLLLVTGCGGGGAGSGTSQASSTPLSAGVGTVQLPSGWKLSLSNLHVLGPATSSPVAANGTFNVSGYFSGNTLVTLVDSSNKAILLGYVDAGSSQTGQISTQQTATALIYLGTGSFMFTPDQRDRARALIYSSSAANQLAKVIATRMAADATALGDADGTILAATQTACAQIAPQTTAIRNSGWAQPSNQTQNPYGLIAVDPSGTQSGVLVGPDPKGPGILVTNTYRRNLKYLIGEKQTSGQFKVVNQGFLSSTTSLSGVLGTLIDVISGNIAYAPNYSGDIPLSLDPPNSKKTIYQIDVVGNGVAPSVLPSMVDPTLDGSAHTQMTWYTAIKEVILPLLASILNMEPNVSQLISANNLSTAYDDLVGIVQSVWDSGVALTQGNVKNLATSVMKGLVNNSTFRQSLINWYAKYLFSQHTALANKLVIESLQELATDANALVAITDKVLGAYDVGAVINDWGKSNWIETWTATVTPANVRLQPAAVTMRPGDTITLQATTGVDPSTLTQGTLAYLFYENGNIGTMKTASGQTDTVDVLTSSPTLTFTAASNDPNGASGSIQLKAYIKPNGASSDVSTWDYLGTATSTISIQQNGTYALTGVSGGPFIVYGCGEIQLSLNGTVFYFDSGGVVGAGQPKGPITFTAKKGDVLNIQVRAWYPYPPYVTDGISALYISSPSGTLTKIYNGFLDSNPPSGQVTVDMDQNFTLP